MIDLGTITTAAGAVGAVAGSADSVIKTVKAVKELIVGEKVKDEDVPKLKSALNEALDAALNAHQREVALRGEIDKLQKQLREIEDFDREAVGYELVALVENSFVYKRTAGKLVLGQTPFFCVNCFDQRRRVILQLAHRGSFRDTLECPSCKTKALVPSGRPHKQPARRVSRSSLLRDGI